MCIPPRSSSMRASKFKRSKDSCLEAALGPKWSKPNGLRSRKPPSRGTPPIIMLESSHDASAQHKIAADELIAEEHVVVPHVNSNDDNNSTASSQTKAKTVDIPEKAASNDKGQPGAPQAASKSSGPRYWTAAEHARFLEALEKFNHKDNKSIAQYVGTRNATQVRTHAQKYFLKLQAAAAEKLGNSAQTGAEEMKAEQDDDSSATEGDVFSELRDLLSTECLVPDDSASSAAQDQWSACTDVSIDTCNLSTSQGYESDGSDASACTSPMAEHPSELQGLPLAAWECDPSDFMMDMPSMEDLMEIDGDCIETSA